MCGRFTLTDPSRLDPEALRVALVPPTAPRYNVAPSQPVLLLRAAADGGREVVPVRWGLIPSWAKDPTIGHRLANARGETLGEKPSFRTAWARRRGVVLADGFFEWEAIPGRRVKQPWWIHRRDGAPFGMGALWERWRDPSSGAVVDTCALVTTAPNALMAPIHDRMPVLLDWGDADQWLAPGPGPAGLVRPADPEGWEAVPVSTVVNSPSTDGPECVTRVTK